MSRLWWLLCCTTLALVACATTDVESVWKDETRTEKLDKVFVLAVLKNPTYRDSVEYGIVNIVNSETLRAVETGAWRPTRSWRPMPALSRARITMSVSRVPTVTAASAVPTRPRCTTAVRAGARPGDGVSTKMGPAACAPRATPTSVPTRASVAPAIAV